ncbi:MAG: ribosome biogenesis GTP-binding protein YihA/YsxC [Bernardetiaceae bacterium]|nr:ribosome biogenesis GTP-binding protein YihA/YsxC [Bernardetiaceae bacterium]
MHIKSAVYISSNSDHQKCPAPDLPEFAFIGRSNVGKSSLINALTNLNKLAKVSATPGKTQIINHFKINNEWYLVDLPGYGYAKVGKSQRAGFSQMIKYYLIERPNLLCTFVLIDIRHEQQANDREFINWLGSEGVPLALVFTKADKLSAKAAQQHVAQYLAQMQADWEELPPYFITSAETKQGREELLRYIQDINQQHAKNIAS